MIRLREEQMEALAASYRDRFLDRLIVHLERVALVLDPDRPLDVRSPAACARLRVRLDHVVAHGFVREPDAAAALEQWELFDNDLQAPAAAAIVTDDDLWPDEKLDRLWALRGGSADGTEAAG